MFRSGKTMRIRFDDFHLAYTAATIAYHGVWPCMVKFGTPQDYAAVKLNDFDSADPFEGQVMIDFEVRDTHATKPVLDMTEQAAYEFAERFAHVRTMHWVTREEYTKFVTYRVEFDSVEAAKICVSFWNRFNSPVA